MVDIKTIEELLGELTLEEKAKLCAGKDFWRLFSVDRLGLPSIMVTDGPHGLRKQTATSDEISLTSSVPATCFPTASGLAATWNRDLLEQMGIALAEECRKENVSVLLGPGNNIKRHPLGGRNFEYFSEDPYLSGSMAAAMINGVQSQNVGTSLKHFVANNHESGRMVVDVIVDERTLREIYLYGFELAVKEAKPWTIMNSYNKVNGSYLSEHRQLLTEILRDEWGFEGMVVTDWGANNDRVKGIKSGQNLEMPYSGETNAKLIVDAVNRGELTMAELNRSVVPVIDLILKSKKTLDDCPDFSQKAHHALARKVAEEGCVLLKNDTQMLPLEMKGKIAVLGALAENTRYQGSGSSQMNPLQLEQPLEEITRIVEDKAEISFAKGYPLSGVADETLIKQAVTLAEESDAVILVAGLTPEYESEGFDRDNLDLPAAQLELINALEPVIDKLVIVLQNGSPVALPFIDTVPAILEAYLGGEAGASAMARILFGLANPSGKLAETFPLRQTDIPSDKWFPGEMRQSQYRESIWIGYRYFDSTDTPVAFPFGHGLSYTQFSYRDLKIDGSSAGGTVRLDETDLVTVTFTIENSGEVAGAEIAQIYIGQKGSSVHRPAKELKGFTKVFLEPGESKTEKITLDFRAFAFWDVSRNGWTVESDQFDIRIGASVSDIRLSTVITIESGVPVGEKNPALSPYFTPKSRDFSTDAFEALLGHNIPATIPSRPFQPNSTFKEVSATWFGRSLFKQLKKRMGNMAGEDSADNDNSILDKMFEEMPLRNLSSFSEGKLKPTQLNRKIHLMNKNWLKFIVGSKIKRR